MEEVAILSKSLQKRLAIFLTVLMLVSTGIITSMSPSRVAAEESDANLDVKDSKVQVEKQSKAEKKSESVHITDSKLEDGDFEVLQGDGTLKYNNDGSVTYGVTSHGKNKIVYRNMPKIKNGVFEADITADSDLKRFGFIYRVQDNSAYTYVGTGDSNNQYFGEIFGPTNKWTSMTNSVALEANKTYKLRVKFMDDTASLYINGDKIGAWTQAEGVDSPGLLGLEKSRGEANINISNVKIKEYVPPTPPSKDPILETLSSDYMDVTVDQVYPRVVEYDVDGKMMYGQETPVYGLKVNNMLYYPEVAFEKVNDQEAIYSLHVKDEYENIDVHVKLSLKVDGNQVVYQIQKVDSKTDVQIETIEFVDLNFISVHDAQKGAEAKLTNLSSDVKKPGDTTVKVDATLKDIGAKKGYYTAFLSTNELSAGVWSSSEVNGYRNLVASRYENENGNKVMGIGSNALYYHRDFMNQPASNTPTVKVVIAEDINDDGQVDWQDAAIEYRDLLPKVEGAETVNNTVGTRIAMNFGSHAQQPFLKTLDNVKKVALATDGLGQAVLLKGYANEGHDSGHPDYGDVGERIGGIKDINALIREGNKYNAEFGVHINAQEAYPEAKSFSEELINGPEAKGWGWLDQSYTIDKLKDLYTGSRAKRLDELKANVPNLDFIYLDVWYQDQWESNRVAEQFADRGWRMTTEFGTAIANYSTWQHWATDKNYGGPTDKGINSEVLRFISNHQRDSWVLNWPEAGGTADHPLLGGFELAGFEGWQSDKNFDQFINMTFDTNVPTKFLQKYYVMNWETMDGDPTKTNLEKEITLKDPSNGDVVKVTRKDNSRERVITLNDKVVLDGDTYLLPWVEQDFETPTPDAKKLYHWNLEGGKTTWELPDEFKNASKVYVYKLTDQGRSKKQKINVKNNQITLNAQPATPYVIEAKQTKGVQVKEWSENSHVSDTGFNAGTLKTKHTKVSGDKKSVHVKRTDQTGSERNLSSGDYYLQFTNPTKDSKVTKKISNLEPGKDYVAEVYVENNSDAKASIQIEGSKQKNVENYTYRSLQKNYVKADSHATNDGYNSKMQRMQVAFTAKKSSAKLILKRESGEGITKFDDIRIVQKSLSNHASEAVFEQDFESVVQGIYPFVVGNTEGVEDNRVHLSQLHAPYTQKGWAGKKVVDDVIAGNWSLKVNTGNKGLVYRTIPQHFHFEAGKTYKVTFDYQTTADSYRFISGNKAIDVRDINKAEGIQINEKLSSAVDTKTATFTVKGSENYQTYIGIFNDGTSLNGGTGKGTFMLDNLRIETVED